MRAINLDSAVKDIQVKHPLVSEEILVVEGNTEALQTAAQAHTLQNIIKSIKLHDTNFFHDEDDSESADNAGPPSISAPFLAVEPSDTAIITALYGWSIAAPSVPADRPRASLSRATSLFPATPGVPRSAFSSAVITYESTPVRSIPRPPPFSQNSAPPNPPSASAAYKSEATMLSCALCQRRIGIWAFMPSGDNNTQPRRPLDVLKEHRSYCPYVVRSTVISSLPVPSGPNNLPATSLASLPNSSLAQVTGPSETEGWRAVLSVILRYGATQKQRLGYARGAHRPGRTSIDSSDSVGETSEETEDFEEIDRVAAMVEGVKTRGVSVCFYDWCASRRTDLCLCRGGTC